MTKSVIFGTTIEIWKVSQPYLLRFLLCSTMSLYELRRKVVVRCQGGERVQWNSGCLENTQYGPWSIWRLCLREGRYIFLPFRESGGFHFPFSGSSVVASQEPDSSSRNGAPGAGSACRDPELPSPCSTSLKRSKERFISTDASCVKGFVHVTAGVQYTRRG
jgi:hypothetical protein